MILLLFGVSEVGAEKLYVVERERSNLAVIEDGQWKGEITGLGKLHHATVKFYRGYGYIISRDGLLSKINLKKDKVIKQKKVGQSSIGLIFWEDWVVVANYAPHTVEILDLNLKPVKSLATKSRNVGIKVAAGHLIFSLMDRDQIWVVNGKLEIKKKLTDIGKMPFDALLAGSHYVVGFFKDSHVGVFNIKDFTFRKIELRGEKGEVLFKIPHFGLWACGQDKIYIPGLRAKKVYEVDMKKWKVLRTFSLEGMPVFAVLSPEGKKLAVNYSGARENYLTFINLKNGKVESKKLGRRVIHFRFSRQGEKIYISSYFENKVKILSLENGKVLGEVAVATPSGIFLVPDQGRKNHG